MCLAFISVGGGALLLILSVVALIMSDTLWVKLVATLYLSYFIITIVINTVKHGFEPFSLILIITLILVGMYAHGVHHMFDEKKRK